MNEKEIKVKIDRGPGQPKKAPYHKLQISIDLELYRMLKERKEATGKSMTAMIETAVIKIYGGQRGQAEEEYYTVIDRENETDEWLTSPRKPDMI